MKPEYLLIKNFGPIQEVELENIAPLTVFIGESGCGKSTILKVLSMCRWVYKRIVLRSYVRQANIKRTTIGLQFKSILAVDGLSEYLKPSTEIIYRRGEYEFSYIRGKWKAGSNIPAADLSQEKVCFISDKRSMISEMFESKSAHKVVNTHLRDTIENFKLAAKEISQFDLEYLDVRFKVQKTATSVRYTINGNSENRFSIDLKNASSGTQTVLPLSLIVEYYAKNFDSQASMNTSLFSYLLDNDKLKDFSTVKNIGELKEKNVHILIEEPELSLDPESQIKMIDFLVDRCFMLKHEYDMTLMMATHSPYIVNYLNLLIKRSQSNSERETSILPSLVQVYEVADGTIVPLIADYKGTTIVDARSMSDVIKEIYNEYNSL